MINRLLYKDLLVWKQSQTRMPLILRGARQVGKTTLVHHLGKSYDQYLYFNLERKEDLDLFANLENFTSLVQLLLLSRGAVLDEAKETLLFLDEVQEKPEVISSLRYFKEDFPQLHIIVAGSLLEFALDKIERVPVGRVEYRELHPLNFKEYLFANGKEGIADVLKTTPFDNNNFALIMKHFHRFALIGGMPAIVDAYRKKQDLVSIQSQYNGLILSYKSDVEKYAESRSARSIIRFLMDAAPWEIDNRIKLGSFGSSAYKAREVKEAFESLGHARIIELIYPTTRVSPPIVPELKRSPRLHFLDFGLINFQLGLQEELLQIEDLHQSSKGKLTEQIVNQEIKSTTIFPGSRRAFWVREEKGTTSEVDIVYPFGQHLIPIEVKAGATGKLRSLHEFMDRCSHHFAIRFYAGKFSVDQLTTRKGKPYFLMNLPYFLGCELESHLNWFVKEFKLESKL